MAVPPPQAQRRASPQPERTPNLKLNKGVIAVAALVLLAGIGAWFFFGRNSLYDSVVASDVAAVRSYLAAGGDPNARSGEDQMPPLTVAAMFGDLQIVNLLIAGGADVNSQDNTGSTALGWASFNGNTAVVKALLDNGVDVTKKNINGTTALQAARAVGHKEIVKLLEDAGAKE